MAGLFNSLANFPKHQAAVTPSDTDGLPHPGIIECLTAGSITVKDADGTSITRTVEAGAILPVYVTQVMDTNTDVDCVVLWD